MKQIGVFVRPSKTLSSAALLRDIIGQDESIQLFSKTMAYTDNTIYRVLPFREQVCRHRFDRIYIDPAVRLDHFYDFILPAVRSDVDDGECVNILYSLIKEEEEE